ncbi:MAG: Amino acid adenylation, partial [Acidobacteria bacterium]|nr:Amino acid adenylation [Acidobacteriota bacterium]
QLDEWQRLYPSLTRLYPATAMQQGMYFHGLLDRSAYVTQMMPTLKGALSIEHFRQAWEQVANRHDIFRTAFVGAEEQLHQLVVADVKQPWHVEDWRNHTADQQATRFEQYRLADLAAGFDFGQAPLQRVSLFRLDDDRYQLLWTHHHILLDGWSVPRVYREVMQAYMQLRGSATCAIEAPADYENYMRWLRSRDVEESYAWWRDYLGDFETATPLGIDRLPAGEGFGTVLVDFDADESQKLEAFARSQQTTLNTIMQLAWAYLLHRYSGEEDVVFGSLISGRPAEVQNIESMLGLFINMIPVKVSFKDTTAITALLGRIQQSFQASQQHGYLPLPVVQRQSRVRAGEPLFETVVAFENYPLDTALSNDDAAGAQAEFGIEKAWAEEGRTNFKLVLVGSYRQNLRVRCDYRDEFSQETIERLMEHLQAILRQMPSLERVADIDILSPAERELFAAVNDTKTNEPNDRFVHELVEAHAASTPEATAIVQGGRSITYAALNQQANRLARHLIASGVTPGAVVALCADRSIEELGAIMAVWKAGASFVPLDPTYPRERLQTMLDDVDAAVVLTQSHLRERLGSTNARTVLLGDPSAWQSLDGHDLGRRNEEPVTDAAAYVIYTSGSTGVPKCFANTHAVLANLCAWHRRRHGTGAQSRGSHLTSIGFDASVLEVWPYLTAGGSIAIVSDEERAEPLPLAARLHADRVTDAMFPTALLEHLGHQDVPEREWEHLRLIIVGGDKLNGHCLPRGCTAKLVNHYGPTETAVVATSFDVMPDFAGAPPIGRPLDNFTVRVLDREQRHVPLGIAGELYIGGAGLAKGYLHRPELTREKFVTIEGERLYRTGDLVRFLPDGNLEFAGRIDDQVKVRGFRIELGEIVARILQSSEVAEAVVIARGERQQKQLVAYLVASTSVDIDVLRTELKRHLPEYMIPSIFVVMDALPLNASGKVDRKALPAPDLEAGGTHVAPRTSTESDIVTIFEEILGYAPAGTDDNFFERGGHSLLASRAIVRLRRRCGVDVPLVALFENPTPATLARVVDAARGTSPASTAIEPLSDYTSIPLTFAQQRLFFIEQFEQGTTSYNVGMTLKVRGDFRPDLFIEALRAVAARQWSLRTRFRVVDDGVRQEIVENAELPVRIVDEGDTDVILDALRFERKLPFDIAGGLLWRGTVYCVSAVEHWLDLTFHHTITDGWSHNLFKREVVEAYAALARGEEPSFEPMPLQYADYAAWQRHTFDEDRLGGLLAHWKTTLDGLPKQHALPLDFPRPAAFGRKGGIVPFELDTTTTEQLKAFCAQSGVTLYMALVAAFSALVSRLSGRDDVVIGTPMANRPSAELERVIGFFVNTVVLRVGIDGRSGFERLAEHVRAVTLDAQQHQDLPFEQLVAELQPERGSGHHPLFQLCFVLHNTPGRATESGGFALEHVDVDEHASMFDLMLQLTDHGDRLTGNFSFDSELFRQVSVEGFAAKFRKLVTAVSRDPKQRLEAIELDEKLALPSIKRVRRP